MDFELNQDEKRALLELARASIRLFLNGTDPIYPSAKTNNLKTKCGVFVTLHKNGELRGCIGFVEGLKPLQDAVVDLSIAAAANDPRFEPVDLKELPEIDIEISVLTPFVTVSDPWEIEIGRDGLLIKQHHFQGLLLPQVASQHQWDKETFLTQTCIKAGLPVDAWRSDDTTIYRFSAIIFGENDFTTEGSTNNEILQQ